MNFWPKVLRCFSPQGGAALLWRRLRSALPGGGGVLVALAVCAAAMTGILFTCSGCRRPVHPGDPMGWVHAASPYSEEPVIRVALLRRGKSLRVESDGMCAVVSGATGREVERRRSLDYRVEHLPGGFLLNGGFYAAPWIEFRPDSGAKVLLDGSPYPGVLRVLSGGEGLTAVNVVGMERYLQGVVGHEMYPSWNPEALKAQAVAARSFALARMAGRVRRDYDLLSTVVSQRYEGGPPPPSVAEAVAATHGVVLVHDGKVAPAYYHSTCGGHTAGASDAFGGPGEEFIRGVRCPYCQDAGPFAWSAEATAEEVAQEVFGESGSRRRATALQAIGRRPDGRPVSIRVFFGDAYEDVPVGRFRERLGRMRLRSERFWIESAPGGFRFVGRGFGHGVGLCQYGAQKMAQDGATFPQVLAYYYPELALARWY